MNELEAKKKLADKIGGANNSDHYCILLNHQTVAILLRSDSVNITHIFF